MKIHYPKVVEISLIITLLMTIVILLSSKEYNINRQAAKAEQVVFKAEDIPITQQVKRPPPPARPSIPVESDEADVDESVTIDDIEWDIMDEPPPPPPPPEEVVDFFAVEVQPELVGGAQAIYEYITNNDLYPEMAKLAGLNGDVLIQFVVGADGTPRNVVVAQEKPTNAGFGDAGVKAIMAMRFKPGKQRDRYVAVNMQQVIRFRIK